MGEYAPNGDASCTQNETETAICSTCGNSITRIINGTMTEHSWSEEWSHSSEGHYKTCAICEATSDQEQHIATKESVCDICGYAPSVKGGSGVLVATLIICFVLVGAAATVVYLKLFRRKK